MRLRLGGAMKRLALLSFCFLSACGPGLPDLDSRLSPEARSAPFPQLQPLGPVLARADTLLPGRAEAAGLTLEARAADLRRRAAALRAMPL